MIARLWFELLIGPWAWWLGIAAAIAVGAWRLKKAGPDASSAPSPEHNIDPRQKDHVQ